MFCYFVLLNPAGPRWLTLAANSREPLLSFISPSIMQIFMAKSSNELGCIFSIFIVQGFHYGSKVLSLGQSSATMSSKYLISFDYGTVGQ